MPLLTHAASNPMLRISRLEKVVSLDTAIISSKLTRGLSSAASEVTLILIAHFSNVADQFVRWCCAATVLLVCDLAPVDIYFVSANAQTRLPVAWNFPWLMVALAVRFAVKTNPMFSILGDRSHMSWVAHTHFWQAFASSLLGWTSLLLHYGLLTPAKTIKGQVLVGIGWKLSRRGLLHHRVQWARRCGQ